MRKPTLKPLNNMDRATIIALVSQYGAHRDVSRTGHRLANCAGFQSQRRFQRTLKATAPVKFPDGFQEMWYFQRMLKEANFMKEAETRAGEALRELLEKIPILHVEGIDAEAAGLKWLALSINDVAGRFPLLGGGTRLACVSAFGFRTYHVPIKRVRSFIARLSANGKEST